ncbi:hypothetical protein MVEN_02128400 [Mycena venus]|uniref:Uncharacterized protein n=1 Tax=Mycena venus TaxID=2733690 RepID=A0A8H6XAF1_9AGAR|nr:hypothetical protein MVEN_02128400 [Mycena venus]
MVNFLTLPVQVILCVLATLATALSVLRATDSVVPLPTPPAGSKVVFVGATDPGIVWSPPWRDAPSACSSGTMRAVSAVGTDFSASYVASYNFRGTGIYVNLQSGDALFQISIDDDDTLFGYSSIGKPVPANCSYDFSATGLADGDHVFKITATGPIISSDSYWNLGLESLAIIQPLSDSSVSNSTHSAVPLPTPPAGSNVVFVGAKDPGIVWSPPWRDAPSACSSGTMRAVSAVGTDYSNSYVASYNFRGTGIYVNLQSGDALFQITIDDVDTLFGYSSIGKPVPANCSYDFSATGLADGDHVFKITATGPIISSDSYWNLGLESLAIIQSGTDSSSSNSNNSGSSSPSASGSGNTAAGGGGSQGHNGLSTTDIIAVVTSIIGAVAAVIGIITGIAQFKKWREAKKRPPSQDFLMGTVHRHS